MIAAAASAGLGAAGVPINVGGMMPGSYNTQGGGANPFGTGQQWRDFFSPQGVSGGGLGATGGISPWDQVYGTQSSPWSQPYSSPMYPQTPGPAPNVPQSPYSQQSYPTQFGQGQGGSNPMIFSYNQSGRRY
jgi:hypothetical protein